MVEVEGKVEEVRGVERLEVEDGREARKVHVNLEVGKWKKT